MLPVLANAGVPMLFLHMPAIFAALLPIIAVESYAAHRLPGRPFKQCLGPVSLANAASMLIGFPLLWLGGVVAQLLLGGGGAHGLESWWQRLYAVTVQAPWLIPYEANLFWMVPAAGLFMLIPAFFLSVWLERVVLERFWKEALGALRVFSFRAHCASYLVLVLLWLEYGFYSFTRHASDSVNALGTHHAAHLRISMQAGGTGQLLTEDRPMLGSPAAHGRWHACDHRGPHSRPPRPPSSMSRWSFSRRTTHS